MKRSIAGVILGFVAWVLVVSILDRVLRFAIDGYEAAEPTSTFDLTMMLWRLAIGAVSSLVAGAIAALIARSARRAPWIAGVILFVLFVPQHIYLWHVFPIWYHLTFLLTLIPLFGLGGLLVSHFSNRTSSEPAMVA